MNDKLRKKLTEQQKIVLSIENDLLETNKAEFQKALDEKDGRIVSLYNAYYRGIKQMAAAVNTAIEIEKQKKGQSK